MNKRTLAIAGWIGLFTTLFFALAYPLGLPLLAFSLFLSACMVWICVADATAFRIPNPAVVLIAAGGVVLHLVYSLDTLPRRLIESLIVLVFMYIVSEIAARLSKKPAFGFGDIKLLAASTLWIGLAGVYPAMLLALVAGLVFTVVTALAGKRKLNQPLPFGVFIALGVWVVWLRMATLPSPFT